jgi:hypothetical protein
MTMNAEHDLSDLPTVDEVDAADVEGQADD